MGGYDAWNFTLPNENRGLLLTDEVIKADIKRQIKEHIEQMPEAERTIKLTADDDHTIRWTVSRPGKLEVSLPNYILLEGPGRAADIVWEAMNRNGWSNSFQKIEDRLHERKGEEEMKKQLADRP